MAYRLGSYEMIYESEESIIVSAKCEASESGENDWRNIVGREEAQYRPLKMAIQWLSGDIETREEISPHPVEYMKKTKS